MQFSNFIFKIYTLFSKVLLGALRVWGSLLAVVHALVKYIKGFVGRFVESTNKLFASSWFMYLTSFSLIIQK